MSSTIFEHSPPHENNASATTGRPPGGTARATGIKTPRKVQWAVDGEKPALDNAISTHELDERGLDPNAFETLTDALERHQSTSSQHLPRRPNPSIPSSPELSTPGSPSFAPIHEVPGESYIDPHETSGLPGTDISRYSQAEATKVVRAHKRGLLGNFNFRQRKKQEAEKREHKRNKSRSNSDSEDVEKEGQPDPPRQLGTGVLSALLSLYDHQRSGASTPSSRLSIEDRRPDLAGAERSPPLSAAPCVGKGSGSGSGSRTPVFWPDNRKPIERNGAGVFGALIASTGNISGAAAPAHSGLAPNLKRPGYHLSRYSLESNVPTAAKPHARVINRSRSTHFEENPVVTIAGGSPATDSSPDSPASESPTPSTGLNYKNRWSGTLKDLPKRGWGSVVSTPSIGTPATDQEEWLDEKSGDQIRKEKKRKRKRAEIYITQHVAEIIQRQEFILKLARAMMMFGGPSHRFQAQVQSTAKVLEIDLACMYLPDVMLISFDDAATGTSNIKLIRQAAALDLGKLGLAYNIYWKVIHDKLSVKEASAELDELMRRKPLYNWWQIILIGAFCSASICSVGFNGSFIDSLVAFPMGALLVAVQIVSARNELYSNVFEITIATLLSFLAAAFASTHVFCYSAIAAASVVLILPGFIVLIGSLELSSRNIVSGAVRLCFACVYALFLGFGLAIGLAIYQKLSGKAVFGADDYMCTKSHPPGSPWYQSTPSTWWAFLTVPMYSFFLSLRNQAPLNKRELPLLVIFSCIGWVTNHFTATKFANQADINAAVGAFAVGFVANLWAKFFRGNAFVIMITGILFQLPSGLGNGGLFAFASSETNGTASSNSYVSGFQTALQLISVAIGMTVGLGVSIVLVHPIQSRRRAGGVFSL